MDRITALQRPCPDPQLYQWNLEMGFTLFPKRRENYTKVMAAKKGEVLDCLPIKLDIENVSRCNYHCTMCQVSDWPGLKRADDMSLEDYKALIDGQYGLIEIKLQGMGEPLMGKCYFEMIEYARQKYIWVRSTTNASLLHVKDNYKRVIDADICELQVSIDGASRETYEKIRRGGKFRLVVDNCIKLNQYCADANRRRTRMWVVVQRENFEELPAFPRLGAEMGFGRLTFSLDLNDWGQNRWKTINDPTDRHLQFDLPFARRLSALGTEHGVDVTFWFIDEKYDSTDEKTVCPWPFERAFVSSDMRIVPCCMIANPEVSDLGDARNFTSEWNSSPYQRFRRDHLAGNTPAICKACYVSRHR